MYFIKMKMVLKIFLFDSSRGRLGILLMLQGSVGTLIGVAIGYFLSYEVGLWLCLLFPVTFLVLFAFMAETPYYLMKRNRMEVSIHIFCDTLFSICFLFTLQSNQNTFFFLHTNNRMLKSRYVFTGMYYHQRKLMQNRWRVSKMTF